MTGRIITDCPECQSPCCLSGNRAVCKRCNMEVDMTTMTLPELEQWRATLHASPHTLQRIDALIEMVKAGLCAVCGLHPGIIYGECSECAADH